ncbi:MAG TPA: DciA family protein [Solimonas sp.]|nr:DciA family protein [Solimonas sp.]
MSIDDPMTPRPDDSQGLPQWLQRQPRSIRDLLDRARYLADLNRDLRQWSDEPWLSQIRLANVRGDTLVVFSSSAAALVQLRYRKQSLLDWLAAQTGLQCTRIESRVRPALAGDDAIESQV